MGKNVGAEREERSHGECSVWSYKKFRQMIKSCFGQVYCRKQKNVKI